MRWKNGREGVRFRAENIRGDIYISVQEHKGGNASGAESETAPDYRCIGRLKNEDFPALYSLYLRREKGEAVQPGSRQGKQTSDLFLGAYLLGIRKEKETSAVKAGQLMGGGMPSERGRSSVMPFSYRQNRRCTKLASISWRYVGVVCGGEGFACSVCFHQEGGKTESGSCTCRERCKHALDSLLRFSTGG